MAPDDLLLLGHLVINSKKYYKLLKMGQVTVLLVYTDEQFQEIVLTRVGSGYNADFKVRKFIFSFIYFFYALLSLF